MTIIHTERVENALTSTIYHAPLIEMERNNLITDIRTFDNLKDELRKQLLPFLRRAFQQIPPINKPQILDIGCGSGVPTLELAHLSGGDVTGIDVDDKALQRLEEKINTMKMGGRVHIVHGSLKSMNFPKESFDILWAEGSIFVLGFKHGLSAWKPFLKAGGYLVVHDAVGNIDQKKQNITTCGYHLTDWFLLEAEIWWQHYYEPLKKAVQEIRQQKTTNRDLRKALELSEQEIQGYHQHPEQYRSVYFIMRKQD
jgi:ubiquinone/menaquinone biosynthesis C-methylase UbiE